MSDQSPESNASSASLSLRHLVLIPTEYERDLVRTEIEELAEYAVEIRICGIGLIESAIQTLHHLHRHSARRAWLVGLAGSYADELEIGKAYEFSHLDCYGIGVGAATNFQSIEELGWSRSFGTNVPDRMTLEKRVPTRTLLSTTAASANKEEVSQKRSKFPDCQAEDMESFSVARACQLAKIPLRVFRGISNRAGDREHRTWKSKEAMQAAIALLLQEIKLDHD